MKTLEWLDALKQHHGVQSDYRLAKILGVTAQTVSGWRAGARLPDALTCYEIAYQLAVDPAQVVADVERERAERAGRTEAASAWRKALDRLSGTAAAVVVGTALIAPSPAQTSTGTTTYGGASAQTLYIMFTRQRWQRAVVDVLAALAGLIPTRRLRLA